MRQAVGYFVRYPDARGLMGKAVDDITLKHPINYWLAKVNRHSIVYATFGHIYSGYKGAEGVFPTTHIRNIRQGR